MLNNLKKYVFLLIIPFLFACNSDDDEAAIDGANIIGTWSFESVDIDWTIDGKDAFQYLEDAGYADDDIDFLEAIFTAGFEDASFTITFNENNTMSGTSEEESFNGTWSLNGDATMITIVSDGENSTFEIFELSKTRLSYGLEESEEVDVDDDGSNETMTFKVVTNLKK